MPSLYEYQKQAVADLLKGKKIIHATMGAGKTAISINWAYKQPKNKVLVITTASKRDTKDSIGRNDFEAEADEWFPGWRESLSSFEVISWAGLVKWWNNHRSDITDYAIIADECSCMKSGVSSGRGRAFIQIANKNDCWTGYTGTPGDTYMDLHAYFVATKKVKNKTSFMRNFCQIQTFKGFPEIVGYNHTEVLNQWWKDIAVTVDTSEMMRQLPDEIHQTVQFPVPKGYKQVKKTRKHPITGEFIETTGEMCATLRKMCLTKERLTWIKDFVQNLGDRAVIFYNFIEDGDKIQQAVESVLPKGAKVWRIDGKHHDIPNEQTCGKYDIVLANWVAGSMALNLQFMNYWVSAEPHYSYSKSSQARGRIKRIGQTKKMFFYYNYCCNTIEEDIYKCLKAKSDFNEEVYDFR